MARFRRLDPPVQEAVLDAVERMLEAAPPPAVARRLPQPVAELHDATLTIAGRAYYLFLQGELDLTTRQLLVLTLAVVVR